MELAKVFTDSMVLQRDEVIKIFGTGSGIVEIEFDKEVKRQEVCSEEWCVELRPRPAGGPYTMRVKLNGEETVLSDIMMGDVWFAFGQSNMEMPLFKTEHGISEAENYSNDNIRFFTVPRRQKKDRANWDWHFANMESVDTPWQRCGGEASLYFCAMGYYFAKEINKELNVPIGVVACNWGGRKIEPFTDKKHLYECEATRAQIEDFDDYVSKLDMEKYEKEFDRYVEEMEYYHTKVRCDELELVKRMGVKSAAKYPAPPANVHGIGRGPYDSWSPSTLWESMISRIVPLRAKGMIWYQGESNSEDTDYLEKYGAFLKCIRDNFGYNMPVYAIELASFSVWWDKSGGLHPVRFVTENNWAFLREQQQRATEIYDNNYLVTSMDYGELFDIHPVEKEQLAKRAAKKALKHTYGYDIYADQPVYKSVCFEGSKAYITLESGEGLYCCDPKFVYIYVAGADKQLKKADVEIIGDNLLCVHSEEVDEPVLVRYAFDNYYEGLHIYNKAGLPLAPFRTDK